MAKIIVNNPRQVINGGAKKYYFKVKGLGGPKGDKGDKGDTGATGPEGPQGNAATVSIGSTTTLPVGYDATVTNSGSIYNAVLNFGIPQGPRGPQGATGATGAKGDKGDQGNPGPQGEKGTNATVYIGTTTTGEPGTQASVYNSGTENNAVLNFTIPRGDVGPSVPLVQETGYSTTKAMSQNATTEALNGKQNTLTAGSNIQISGSTISATDTKYSAGNGITLTGTQFSANTSVLATKNDLGSYYTKTQIDSQMAAKQDDLVAGSNIQIAPDGKTISATDTTYTAGTGLTLTGTEFSADTTVLATQTDLTTALAPKLEAEVVTELPTTGAEGKLYLTPKAHTTSTATGNPITTTVTEEAGKIESFQLDGDTLQDGAPSPENPVAIQTVTGDQTVTVVGKNLFDVTATPWFSGRAYDSNGEMAYWSGYMAILGYQPVEPNSTYAFSNNADKPIYYGLVFYDAYKNKISNVTSATRTFTTPADCHYVRFSIQNDSIPTWTQLEAGSTATAYIPYSKQTLPINLGSLELCKLGTYQDYIWKDGEDWKVHKAVAKHALTPNEGWLIPNPASYPNLFQTNAISDLGKLSDEYTEASTSPQAYCEALVYLPGSRDVRTTQGFSLFHTIEGGVAYNIARINIAGFTTTTQLNNWLSTCNASFWYGVKNPTDTTITDTTLIAQLEAIRTASLQNGANTITNTATGSNLVGDMEIGYYGFNPRNRYDKFIWLDLNNNYEQIGGE